MTIERDEWLYVRALSAERACKFFGLPLDTEVRIDELLPDMDCNIYAVRVLSVSKEIEQ